MPRDRARTRGRPRDRALPAKRREEILCAATRVFATEGFQGADLQAVADRLGIAKGTIYTYFPSKKALFFSAVDRGMQLQSRAVDDAIRTVPEPLARIRRAIEAYLRFFHERPELCELIILERAEFRERRTPTYFRHRDANRERWREFYGSLMRRGVLRRMPVEDLLGVIGNLVYGTMFTNFFAGTCREPEQQADDIIQILFRGILTPLGEKQWAADHHARGNA